MNENFASEILQSSVLNIFTEYRILVFSMQWRDFHDLFLNYIDTEPRSRQQSIIGEGQFLLSVLNPNATLLVHVEYLRLSVLYSFYTFFPVRSFVHFFTTSSSRQQFFTLDGFQLLFNHLMKLGRISHKSLNVQH